jgi:hypothetical protein
MRSLLLDKRAGVKSKIKPTDRKEGSRNSSASLFPYESLETLFPTLSTLPALESVSFGAPEERQVDESTFADPESLTELLRVPILRLVHFNNFSFTASLFQATANALMEGTAVTKLDFTECSFPAVECYL